MCLLRKNLNCLSRAANEFQPIRFLNYCSFKANLLTFWICDFQIWKTSIPFALNSFHFTWQPCDSHPNHWTGPYIRIPIYVMAEPKERFNASLHGWDVAGRFTSVTSSYKLKWEPFSSSGMDGNGKLLASSMGYGIQVWLELRPQILMSHCKKRLLFSLLGFLTSSTPSDLLPSAGKLAGRPGAVWPYQHKLQFEPFT